MPRPPRTAKTKLCVCSICIHHLNANGEYGVYYVASEYDAHRLRNRLESDATNTVAADPLEAVDTNMDDLVERMNLLMIEDGGWNMGDLNAQMETSSDSHDSRAIAFKNDHHFNWPASDEPEIAQMVMFILVFTSVIFSLSRRSSDLLLTLLRCLVDGIPGLNVKRNILQRIPKGSRTVRYRYQLFGRITIYAVCPKCHAIYKPEASTSADGSLYPETCSNVVSARGGECGEQLVKTDNKMPIKRFICNSVVDFIGSLVARGSLEGYIDEACDNLRRFSDVQSDGPFEANFLKQLRGHRGGTLFIERGDELRLAFALSVDFFNVEGVRSGAAKMSCGVISLVCLNLPENIRYKYENMFLAGIIPGPDEPDVDQINHYLVPIVDEFCLLWDPGFHILRTASAPEGRVARAAIALVVCDLPVARKVAGLHGFSSKKFPCSVCQCSKQDMGKVDETFGRRDRTVLKEQAEAWRATRSKTERKRIIGHHGIRWSEFWRLPYWDPCKQLVVDPMHCLLLGLVQNHFSKILPLTKKAVSEKLPEPPAYVFDFEDVPSREDDPDNPVYQNESDVSMDERGILQVPQIHKLLLGSLNEGNLSEEIRELKRKLDTKKKAPLVFVWKSLGLPVSTLAVATQGLPPSNFVQKPQYIRALVNWRLEKPLRCDVPTIRLTTPELLDFIAHVIHATCKPTWLRSVPSDFHSSTSGKLKADEWRTLCTIYLPLALVIHCHLNGRIQDVTVKQRFEVVLEHTMALVQAVTVLFRKTIHVNHVQSYDRHIKNYVRTLRSIHPWASLVPNMHMATHITDFLPLFGSIYSWWTFPFERLIGTLQELPTNNRPGQLEATMSNSFVAMCRLRQWCMREDCPPGISACLEAINVKYMQERICVSDPGSSDSVHIDVGDSDVRRLAQEYNGTLRATCKWNDVQYTTRAYHKGNSQIFFCETGSHALYPAFIEYIIDRDEPIFVVRRLCRLLLADSDPFTRFPDFPARICFMDTAQPEIISCHAVRGHFVSFQVDESLMAVVSLCQVN